MNEPWPHACCIVGAGLMGTSFAHAVRKTCPCALVDAVEINEEYRAQLDSIGIYRRLYRTVAELEQSYDLIVLAVPIGAAVKLLPEVMACASVVVDLCSVKGEICAAARQLTSQSSVFIPSHPMAGKASGGPTEADAELFVGRPWIFLDAFKRHADMLALVQTFGAKAVFLPDALTHDKLMAGVSHGIHLASLSAMLASDERARPTAPAAPAVAGPALWDITRLAASPPEFWTETLLQNRMPVIEYIRAIQAQLDAFADVLEEGSVERLSELLKQARRVRKQWEEERGAD